MTHYKRRRKLNEQDTEEKVDFIDDSGDKWQEFTVYHHNLKKWMEIVSSFLQAIGLGEIMSMVTFDFCDFLKVMGVPSKISPPDLLYAVGMIATGGDSKSTSNRVGDAAKFNASSNLYPTFLGDLRPSFFNSLTNLPINFNITSDWLRLLSIIFTIDEPTTAPSAILQISET